MTGHKCGFVNIIGKPNAGKSTLMNSLLGERLSIVSAKAQTTRHRIKGILNTENSQIILSDTPGILHDPAYLLHKKMLAMVDTAIEDADLIIYLVDALDGKPDESILDQLQKAQAPVIILFNKTDKILPERAQELIDIWKPLYEWNEMFFVSALQPDIKDTFMDVILKYIPEHEPFFPKDQLTDLSERFFVSEIIREKIFQIYQQEIPYSTEVRVESFKDSEAIVKILANIYVMRETQKPIIIGKGGEMIKKLGIKSRLDIEKFLDKKVYLELFVKVSEDWRNKPNSLRNFGYDNF